MNEQDILVLSTENQEESDESSTVISRTLRLALDQDGSIFPGERLLTVYEVAAFLRLEERTMFRLLESKDLPSFKIRGQIRILLSDLIEYLRRCYRIRPYQDGIR